jgi:hypothetical protein
MLRFQQLLDGTPLRAYILISLSLPLSSGFHYSIFAVLLLLLLLL